MTVFTGLCSRSASLRLRSTLGGRTVAELTRSSRQGSGQILVRKVRFGLARQSYGFYSAEFQTVAGRPALIGVQHFPRRAVGGRQNPIGRTNALNSPGLAECRPA
jgi:hypothetical protein